MPETIKPIFTGKPLYIERAEKLNEMFICWFSVCVQTDANLLLNCNDVWARLCVISVESLEPEIRGEAGEGESVADSVCLPPAVSLLRNTRRFDTHEDLLVRKCRFVYRLSIGLDRNKQQNKSRSVCRERGRLLRVMSV